MKLRDLLPAPYNPRAITPEALEGLKESIDRFGDLSGLVWNKATGHIVAGHQRLEALKAQHGEALWIEEALDGCKIRWDTEPEGEGFPIRVVEWDDETEKLANVAANNPHTQGYFVKHKLDDLFSGIGSDLSVGLRLERLIPSKGDSPSGVQAEGGETDDSWTNDVQPTSMPTLEDAERQPFQQVSFFLHDDQAESVKAAVKKAIEAGPFDESLTENKNSNAIVRVCEAYLGAS